ncbi:MAG TPA: hypothetical protein VF838_18475 [Trebonia sp.]
MNEHDTSDDEDTNPKKQETKPARVARDPFHPTKTTKALYGAAGGVAAFGGGAIAHELMQSPPAQPGIEYAQDLSQSPIHAPDTISVEDMKVDMRVAYEHTMSDPVARQRYEDARKRNEVSLRTAVQKAAREYLESERPDAEPQAAELRVFTVDAARTHIADEVRQPSLALNLSVEAASAFAAGLLLDIIKEVRNRFIGKIVDAIFKGRLGGKEARKRFAGKIVGVISKGQRGVQQPDTATQTAPADAAAGVSAKDAEIQHIVDELARCLHRLREQEFRETVNTAMPKYLGASTDPEQAESDYRVACRILGEVFDGEQRAMADRLCEGEPKFGLPPVKRRDAERIAAITRILAANLITSAEMYGTSAKPGRQPPEAQI